MAEAKEQIKKIKNNPMETTIKKGITTSTIQDGLTANNSDIKKAKKELLQELVNDQQILDILLQEENMQKLNTRMEYRLKIKDSENRKLATANRFNKSLEKMLIELRNNIPYGESIEEAQAQGTPRFAKKLKEIGYVNVDVWNNGKVNKIEVQIIFRKAR